LRTQRYGPTATNRRGESQSPGVPRPTVANAHWHARCSNAPARMSVMAGQTTGRGLAPPRVRIHHGAYTPPAPDTTRVKSDVAHRQPHRRSPSGVRLEHRMTAARCRWVGGDVTQEPTYENAMQQGNPTYTGFDHLILRSRVRAQPHGLPPTWRPNRRLMSS